MSRGVTSAAHRFLIHHAGFIHHPRPATHGQRPGQWRLAPVPEGHAPDRGVRTGRQWTCRTIAITRSSRSPGNCRMCLIEMGMPKMGPDRKPVLGRRRQAEDQLDAASADLLRDRCLAKGCGVRTQFAAGRGMPRGRDGISAHQSSARLPDLRSGGRMPAPGIQRRVRPQDSRFLENKVKKPKNVELGPRVTLDDERCILCSRCIRFSKEIAKDDVLGFIDRGSSHRPHRASGQAA